MAIVKENKKINPIISDKEAKQTKVNLQTTDGKTFGEISASAYSAIRGDYLDKYSPTDDNEKKVLNDYKSYVKSLQPQTETTSTTDTTNAPTEKDGFFPWLGKQAMAGLGQFNKSISATLDFILPTEFLGRYDFISNMNDYYTNANNYYSQEAAKSSASRGKGWDIGGDVIAGTVAALPNAILAYMSAGTSLGAQGASTGLQASSAAATAVTGSTAKQMLGNAVKTVAKNPMYWSSFLQTVGNDYEDAKANGANEFVASSTAILTSLLNAGVEVTGGIETLPTSVKQGGKKAIWEWVKSSVDEGKEEVIQGIITNSIAKMAYDSDRKVINPKESLKEFALGTAVGGILGGGQTALGTATRNATLRSTGKNYSDIETANALIEQGLQSPKGTESREIAEQLNEKLLAGKKISNAELGQLVYANEAQISKENRIAENSDETTHEHKTQTSETTLTPTPTDTPATTQGKTSIEVGDVFKGTTTGNTVRIVDRNEDTTTVAMQTADGEIQKNYNNSAVDALLGNSNYEFVGNNTTVNTETQADTDSPSVVSEPKNITLTQMGDFYEAFGDDAVELAEKLNLQLTSKTINGQKVQMVGFPVHVFDKYKSALGSNYNFTVSSTPTVTNINAENMHVTDAETVENADVTNTDVDNMTGELLSLKHTKNIYSVFKGSERMVMGDDIITDGVCAVPYSEEALTEIKKMYKGDIVKGDYSMSKLYHKENDIVIQGNPKVYKDNQGNRTYVFFADGKRYTAQQKYIDAFNKKGYVIKAKSNDTRVPWTVHNADGELVALFAGMLSNSKVSFDGVLSVSEVLEEKKATKNANAQNQVPTDNSAVTQSATEISNVLTEESTTPAETADIEVAENAEVVNTQTENVSDTAENAEKITTEAANTPAPTTDTTEDLNLAEGEILTLKHTKNPYSVFKGADMVAVGPNHIMHRYGAIPYSEKALAEIKKVWSGEIGKTERTLEQYVPTYTENDVIIQGNPKVMNSNNSKNKLPSYVFIIGDTAYVCQQKFIDAYSVDGNIIKANKDTRYPWAVFNEDGELVAVFLPMMSGKVEDYANLPTVNDVLTAKKAAKEQKKAELAKNQAAENKTTEAETKEAPEDATHKNSLSDYTKDMKPMQKGKVEKTLNNPYKTKEYGLLTYAEFMERSVADGKELTVHQQLKSKVLNEHYDFEYSKGLEASYNKHSADYRAKGINRFDLSVEARGLKDGKGTGENIKTVDPELYYHLTNDKSILPESCYDKTYCVMQDDNTFYSVPKTAYDYGIWLQKQTNEAPDVKLSLSTDVDRAYFDAIESGDMETAQKLVEDYARERGYSPESEHQTGHIAPSNNNDFDVPIYDLTAIYPSDVYEKGVSYYGTGESYEYEAMRKLNAVRGNPDKKIMIYRAVPASVKEDSIRNGDWVTVSREYAKLHGESNIPGKYRIISAYVPAKYVFTDGNSLAEQGYDTGSKMAYANTKNNRKLLETITYDNDGNVIPLSKRFSKRNIDERYSIAGRGAKTADVKNLNEAKTLYESGASNEDVFYKTGWFVGQDGEWRFEIDDSEAVFYTNPKLTSKGNNMDGFYKTGNLSDILYHDGLYEAYPFLKNYTVIIQETESGVQGNTFPENNQIVLSDILFLNKKPNPNKKARIKEIEATPEYKEYNKFYTDEAYSNLAPDEWLELEETARNKFFSSDLGKEYHNLNWGKSAYITTFELTDNGKTVLMHEIQHAIQSYEGFERGASPEYWKRKKGVDDRTADELYQNTAGEIEARDVANRLGMTSEERRSTFPESAKPNGNIVFAENKSVNSERGTDNEQSGNNSLLGNSRRTNNESAGEQDRQLQSSERENQGKTEAERKAAAKKLFAEQKTGQEIITTQKGKIRINTINPDSYDADMQSIVDEYKNDGIETVLFVGSGEKAFDGNKKLKIDGFAIGNKVYLRYDGKTAPQNLKKHEIVHIKWDTPEMQSVRESILGKMSEDEKNAILNEQRYLDYAEVYGDDIDAILEEFVADTLAEMNTHTEQYADVVSEYWNGGDVDSFKVSEYTESIDAGGKYDYTKPFAEQVDDWKRGKIPKNDSLLVGATPDVFKKIGLNALPVTINQTHIDYALNGTKNADHNLGEVLLKQLPEAIKEPIAIISSKTKNSTSLIAMLELKHGGEQIIVPVVIDGFGHQNGIRIDSNALTSAYGRNNSLRMLAKAIGDEADGKLFSVYYLNKNKATALLQGARVTMPKMPATRNDGFIHSIAETDSPVKTKYKSVTETQQFKRWFGDWENNPEIASKVVNEDGTPKVVYHGTDRHFNVFTRTADWGYHFGTQKAAEDRLSRNKVDEDNRIVIPAYLNLRNPITMNDRTDWRPDKVVQELVKKGYLTESEVKENWLDSSLWDLRNHLISKGYDGVVYTNKHEDKGSVSYTVFEPTQIKSATDNIGTFDGSNPDIRYALSKDMYFDMIDFMDGVTETTPVTKRETVRSSKDVKSNNKKADVKSSAFKDWFGDWENTPAEASRIVNEDGTPKIMYHGTDTEFWTFDENKTRTKALNFGKGFYFAAKKSMAENYTESGRVMETYLNLRNPYVVYGTYLDEIEYNAISTQANEPTTRENVSEILQKLGYDGIIAKNYNGTTNPINQVVVFDASQIKSATDNIGTYDKNKKDIRYSRDVGGIASLSNKWNGTEPVSEGQKKSEQQSIGDIVKSISDKFGIPISTGKVTVKNASGIYKEKSEAIRTRITNNLPTISHELGHHFDKLYSLSELDSIDNLREVIPAEFLDNYEESEKNGEAVAEFFRVYLRNTNDAHRLSPDFYADFVRTVSKEDLTALNEIASAVNSYLSQNFGERVDSAIVSSTKKERVPFGDKWNEIYTDWVDAYNPIKDAVDFVENVTGQNSPGKGNAYVLATNSLNAHTIANYLICDGFRDLDGNMVDAKSFVDSIGMVDSKNVKLLDKYLVLRHSLEWIAPQHEDVTAKRVFADDTLENVEEIKKQIAEIEKEHPEIKTAAENLYEYQNNVIKHFVIPAGGMSAELLADLNRKYPSYVPFYRAVGKQSGMAKSTFANQTSPIKTAKGSGADIISPVESIIRNTEKMVKLALRNQTANTLGQYADTIDGFGQFMEKVTPDMIPHISDLSKHKEKFTDALQQIVSSSDDYFAISEALDAVFGDSLTDFTPIANASKKIITVLRDGKPSYYQIHDEDLYKAVAELSSFQLESAAKWSNMIMQPMKMLTTQNNPIFAGTNAIRDFGTAYKLSDINNPISFAIKYALSLKGILSNSEEYNQYKAMGGGHSSELTASIDNISKTLRRVAQKDMGRARRLASALFVHPVETVARFNDLIESTPRFMEFQRTLEADGDLQEAIYNANDLTTNFSRKGASRAAKEANAFIMYNNAAIQGLDKMARTFKDPKKRYKTLLKWGLNALIMAALQHFWNDEVDEEGWQNLSAYKKNNFYNFAVGDGQFISLPKPRENGILDSFTERTIEYVFGYDEAFYDFGGYIATNIIPPMLEAVPDLAKGKLLDAGHSFLGNTVLGGIADVGWNEDFKGTPIESAYDKYNPSNERYSESTTKLAYALGQTEFARDRDLSPKQIDHLISSYTGILGQVNKALFPMNEERRDVTIGLRNKFISDSNYSTDVLNKMYENEEKAEKAFMYDGTIDSAVEYEQNAIITGYISGMNKAVKALPKDEQRNGRAYLLKSLNRWNYDNTASQAEMLSRLDGETVSDDCIVTSVPKSNMEWTVTATNEYGGTIKGADGKALKIKCTYQMTPQEYDEYIKDYLTLLEKYRSYQAKTISDTTAYTQALTEADTEVKKVLKKKYQQKYYNKAEKVEK